MPRPLGQLRIMMSSRVLLDLEEAEKVFREKGVEAYTNYLRCEGEYRGQGDPELNGFRRLGKGPMFDVAVALSKLNTKSKPGEPLVEIGLSCKDELASADVIFLNLSETKLGNALEWETFTSGYAIDQRIHRAFKTDLFLTRSMQDAQTAIDLGIAAAVINFPPAGTYDYEDNGGPVDIIVDGDSVAFGDSAEVGFRRDIKDAAVYGDGVNTYKGREHQQHAKHIEAGPFTAVLAKISKLNKQFAPGEAPIRIGLLTARGALATSRAVATLVAHGVNFNYPSGCMGGAPKHEWLEAFRPHLFLDDQKTHLERGRIYCPTGEVPYVTGGPMHSHQLEETALQAAKSFDAAAQGKVAVVEQDNTNRGPLPLPKAPGNQPS